MRERHVDIPVEVGLVVAKTAAALNRSINYLWGHPQEVVNRMQLMVNNTEPAIQESRFPLVALFTDIPVRRRAPAGGFFGRVRLHMVVANITKQEYTAPERLQYNFQPTIQPIKTELVYQLEEHTAWTYPGDLDFEETERYYWGKQGLYGSTANMFNDFIDCTELRDIDLNVKKITC